MQHQHQSNTVINDLSPDLTPMLDILFILLVFFLLTAGAVFQSLDLTLPSSVTDELDIINEPEHILLEIRQQEFAVNSKPLSSFKQMERALDAQIKANPGHELIIAGDNAIFSCK